MAVQVARHRSGRSAGFGIVTFHHPNEAITAMNATDGGLGLHDGSSCTGGTRAHTAGTCAAKHTRPCAAAAFWVLAKQPWTPSHPPTPHLLHCIPTGSIVFGRRLSVKWYNIQQDRGAGSSGGALPFCDFPCPQQDLLQGPGICAGRDLSEPLLCRASSGSFFPPTDARTDSHLSLGGAPSSLARSSAPLQAPMPSMSAAQAAAPWASYMDHWLAESAVVAEAVAQPPIAAAPHHQVGVCFEPGFVHRMEVTGFPTCMLHGWGWEFAEIILACLILQLA